MIASAWLSSGGVDHPALEREYPPFGLCGGENAFRPVKVVGGRPVGVAHDGHLRRVDARRCGEADRRGVRRRCTEPTEVGDVEVDRVENESIERGGRQQDGGPGVPRNIAVGSVRGPARDAAETGDEIFCAPHHPGGVADRGEAGGGDDAARRLDQRHDVQRSEDADVPGVFALGQHHGGVLGSGDRLQVELLVRVHGWIDPHHGARRIQGCVEQRPPRECLVRGGNAVLQIEDDDVRGGGGLRDIVPDGPLGRTTRPAPGVARSGWSRALPDQRCAYRLDNHVAVLIASGVLQGDDALCVA